MTLFITSIHIFILVYFCLPKVDLEVVLDFPIHFNNIQYIQQYSHSLYKSLGYFLTYVCTNFNIMCNLCTSTWNNLYLMIDLIYLVATVVLETTK